MKKHDDGYVLVLVMVVLLVICIVATSMMTIAMKGLKEQKQSVAQMQDRYAAEGEIEKFVAILNHAKEVAGAVTIKQVKEEDVDYVQLLVSGNVAAKLEGRLCEDGAIRTVNIKVVQGTAQVHCQLKLQGNFDDNGTIRSLTSWEYLSYQITSVANQEVTR